MNRIALTAATLLSLALGSLAAAETMPAPSPEFGQHVSMMAPTEAPSQGVAFGTCVSSNAAR